MRVRVRACAGRIPDIDNANTIESAISVMSRCFYVGQCLSDRT